MDRKWTGHESGHEPEMNAEMEVEMKAEMEAEMNRKWTGNEAEMEADMKAEMKAEMKVEMKAEMEAEMNRKWTGNESGNQSGNESGNESGNDSGNFFRTTTAELLVPHPLLTNSLPAAPEVKGPSSTALPATPLALMELENVRRVHVPVARGPPQTRQRRLLSCCARSRVSAHDTLSPQQVHSALELFKLPGMATVTITIRT